MDIQEIVSGIASSQAFQDVASKVGVSPDQAQTMLHGVLDHVEAGGALESTAETVAAKAGIDPGLVQQFLPSVLPLLQGHAENASEGVQGVLGRMIGSVGGAEGLLGLAKGLFGQHRE
ncbi:MAG: hypothetical protein ABI906_08065 [Pseudomonadota bacterium]